MSLQPIPAMIMAAGRGERMRPLTDTTPKPLLRVHAKPLIDWHVEALALGGFHRLVINTAWLGDQLPAHFSAQSTDPRQVISYSHEGRDFGYALETAGGISRALPLLGEVFWVLAGDVYMPGFAFEQAAVNRFIRGDQQAHVWLVPNPAHHPKGDFGRDANGLALNLEDDSAAPRYTYSTIGLYRREFFSSMAYGNPLGVKAPLAPMLRKAMDHQEVSAELYTGPWVDVGTPARLDELNRATPLAKR